MGWGVKLLCCSMAIVLAGCSDPSAQTTSISQAEVQKLRVELDALKQKADILEFRVNLQNVLGSSVLLEPSDEGFSVLKTQFGTVTVSMDDIKAHGNSTRIKLRFGNATSASLQDVSVKLEWGKADKNGLRETAVGSKEFKVVNPLGPGRWTSEEFTLDRITAPELAFVNVGEFQAGSIHLYK